MRLKFTKQIYFKILILTIFFSVLFGSKIYLNNFLMAENGDTYDFFRIAYELQEGNFLYESKRLPLFPLLFVPFNPDNFVEIGRIITNLIYFAAVILFYKLIALKFELNLPEKILFTLVFAFNFVIFDNSFFILADSLLLFLTVLFFYLFEKGYSLYILTLVGVLAFYTRFEGILLLIAFAVFLLFQKRYAEIFKTFVSTLILSLPLFVRLYFTSQSEATYLADEVGFTLTYQNILKALGSLLFGTGGFWLFCLFILDRKTLIEAKNPLSLFKKLSSNLYFWVFTLFVIVLVAWGFFIRLYTVPIFISLIFFIYLWKRGIELKNTWLLIFPLVFYIYNLQVLDHFDLGYFKFSKAVAVIFSLVVLGLLWFKISSTKIRLYLLVFFIIVLNLTIFFEKFFATNYKYYTLVQASEFSVTNNLKNVAYFDESGVQKWYFKDFAERYKYFINSESLSNWLKINKIEYIMITEEMGYQIDSVNKYKEIIKRLEIVKEFKSPYIGGKTTIYKIENHKIPN